MKYDVFISYKRDGGSAWAELIRAILVHKYHLKVFLDVETMHGGEWTLQLDNAIRDSRNVIMVLFKDIGKKIKSENDVFVQEIKHAKEYQKTIIPFYSLDCDLSNIAQSKVVPTVIKEVVLEQHGIVKYYHENTETTYDLLRKQLDVKIELDICSQRASCFMTYHIDNEPPLPTVKIEENSKIAINLNRTFVGDIHISLYTEESHMMLKYLIRVGKSSERDHVGINYNEIYNWQPDKEICKQLSRTYEIFSIIRP